MIEKQREKEFLFELERICHNFNLVIESTAAGGLFLTDADLGDIDRTTGFIEMQIDELRTVQ